MRGCSFPHNFVLHKQKNNAQVSITILFQIAQDKYTIYPIDVQLQLGLRRVSAVFFNRNFRTAIGNRLARFSDQ